jgi:Ca2+-binding RTX toxin-like protein
LRRRRRPRWLPWAVSGTILLTGTAVVAVTSQNVVPVSDMGHVAIAVSPNVTKPSECDGIDLMARSAGTGVVVGSPGNDLVVGSSLPDTMSGLGGDDCLLGKEGNDIIDGGPGADVCLGGPGTETFVSCETQIPD